MYAKCAAVVFTAAVFAATGAYAAGNGQQESKQTGQQTPRETTSNTKRETPSATTKEKKVTVVGKVDAYTAGKSLEVRTPHGHHRRFDLDEKNATVTGAENVKVGEMVRVTEKRENGKMMIDIEPYTSASHGASKRTDTTGAPPSSSKHEKSPKY